MIILLIAGAVVVAFFAVVLIAALYQTPSCTDGVQNQDETGIDCGGPCAYLCTEQQQPPVVLFTKVISNGAGRTDIIAMIENKNINAAAKNVPYRITLYDADHVFLKSIDGTLDLPPGATAPAYLPGVVSGNQRVTSAFLEIAVFSPQWFTMTSDPRIVPLVLRTTRSGTANAPRIEATLANPSATALSNVRVIVLVKDAKKGVIAVSETIVPTILAQGQEVATFTWNNAFVGTPSSIEVIPIISLP
jgi:hypothetical protein